MLDLEFLANLAAIVAPVFVLAAMGYAWGRFGQRFDQEFITRLVTLVGAPCLVFTTLVKVRLSLAEMATMGAATLACLLLFAVVGAVALRVAGLKQGIYLPSLVFPNIGNMGLPVCLFAFGERGLGLAMIYFTICTVLQFTLGPAIAAGRLRLGMVARTPFLYAAALGLAMGGAGLSPPAWLMNSLNLIGAITIPLMLMGLGVALGQFQVRGLGRQLAVSAGRLALGAAGGWLIATLWGLQGAAKGVLVLESAMPVALFNYLFARLYGEKPDEVAGLVLLSTGLSFLVLPVLVAVLIR